MKKWILLPAVLLTCAFLLVPSRSFADGVERYAFIVGNGDYKNNPRLKRSEADAETYANIMRGYGWNVTKKTDLTYAGFEKAFADFVHSIKNPINSEVALFYSGHGVLKDTGFFLLATDTQTSYNKLVDTTMTNLQGLLKVLADKGVEKIVFVIDACRDVLDYKYENYSLSYKAENNRTKYVVLHSSQPGEPSYESLPTLGNKNSIFTEVFSKELENRSNTLKMAFENAARKVAQYTTDYDISHVQEPRHEGTLFNHFANFSFAAPTVSGGSSTGNTAINFQDPNNCVYDYNALKQAIGARTSGTWSSADRSNGLRCIANAAMNRLGIIDLESNLEDDGTPPVIVERGSSKSDIQEGWGIRTVVVLKDKKRIDKQSIETPGALFEVLGNYAFEPSVELKFVIMRDNKTLFVEPEIRE